MTDERPATERAAEVADLRARLAEAEATLQAIQDGEVDAVVISGGRGEQVYTLTGADRVYRRLIETMSEAAVTLSEDAVILYGNAALAGMLGRPPEQLVGTTLRSYLPPANQQALDDILTQARTEPCRREIQLTSGTGLLVPVYLSASRLQGEGAELVFCLVLTDLTQQRSQEKIVAAKDELASAKAFLDGVINAIADPVFVKDEKRRFVLVNDAFCKIVGRPRAALLGAVDDDMFPEAQASVFRRMDAAVLETGEENLNEESLSDLSSGEVRAIVTRKSRYIDPAGRRFLTGVIRDITDLKRADQERQDLEEQLRSSQKLEAIGSLAGGVAHDFNNLLSVILSYTDFALEALREGDPLRDDLLEVQKAGERGVALTRQLLAFSRKQLLQPVVLDLNQVAAGVERLLRRILGEDIDYVQVLAPDLGLVRADPGQIEQVLMNLAVNARDAMPKGGKLTIETSNLEIDADYAAHHAEVAPGPHVMVAVSDTGCGMDTPTQARLFEPFFTTKEPGKGTGLGLATVHGIVKQSGGHIWFYSEPGHGTTFKIYLPFDPSVTAPTEVKTAIPQRSRGTETILVVEDEQALRKVARRVLEAAGHRVLTATDGEEALRTSAQYPGEIQLLLTDMVMPRMGGRALVQEIIKTRPSLLIVYMSGYTDDAIIRHGMLDAGTTFLAKPFTGATLMRKVREMLDAGGTQ